MQNAAPSTQPGGQWAVCDSGVNTVLYVRQGIVYKVRKRLRSCHLASITRWGPAHVKLRAGGAVVEM